MPSSGSSRPACGTPTGFSRCVLAFSLLSLSGSTLRRTVLTLPPRLSFPPQVACEDLASVVKDREVSSLRSKHVAALQEEMGLEASGEGHL